MRKTILATALTLVVAMAPAAAQRANLPTGVAEKLALTESQKSELEARSAQRDGRNLWAVAADLQEILTPEQKQTLLERGRIAGAYRQGVRDGGARQRTVHRERSARDRRDRTVREGRSRDSRMRGDRNRAQVERRPAVDRLARLDDAQHERLRALREEHRTRLEALNRQLEAGEIDDETLRQRRSELNESLREEAAGVFTAEQRSRLQKMRARSRAGVGRPARRAVAAGQGMPDALNLNDDQRETLRIHAALVSVLAGPHSSVRSPRPGNPRRIFPAPR